MNLNFYNTYFLIGTLFASFFNIILYVRYRFDEDYQVPNWVITRRDGFLLLQVIAFILISILWPLFFLLIFIAMTMSLKSENVKNKE
jgi:hypothetical protein